MPPQMPQTSLVQVNSVPYCAVPPTTPLQSMHEQLLPPHTPHLSTTLPPAPFLHWIGLARTSGVSICTFVLVKQVKRVPRRGRAARKHACRIVAAAFAVLVSFFGAKLHAGTAVVGLKSAGAYLLACCAVVFVHLRVIVIRRDATLGRFLSIRERAAPPAFVKSLATVDLVVATYARGITSPAHAAGV